MGTSSKRLFKRAQASKKAFCKRVIQSEKNEGYILFGII